MIISDLYETEITCSNYNPSIDAENIQVTVRLVDFNKNPVPDKDVTLTVDKGSFTAVASTTVASVSANAKNITAKTNSEGKIIGIYKASEWGICTFNANNTNIQINVTGYKLVQSIPSSATCYSGTCSIKEYRNQDTVCVVVDGNFTVTGGDNKESIINRTPVTNKPPHYIKLFGHQNNGSCLRINPNGDIVFTNSGSNTNMILRNTFVYPLSISSEGSGNVIY